jgi:hypothetical protein
VKNVTLDAPEQRGSTGFGGLFEEFEKPRRGLGWLGVDPHLEDEAAEDELWWLTPIRSASGDASVRAQLLQVRNRPAQVPEWSEGDVFALSRFYGGSIVGSYKNAMVRLADLTEYRTRYTLVNTDFMTAGAVIDATFETPPATTGVTFEYFTPSVSTVPQPTAEQRARFGVLLAEWQSETGASSNLLDAVTHGAYQQIIGLGEQGLRLVLEQLEDDPGFWFWALGSMAPNGENPAQDADSVEAARDMWLAWGREKGYLPNRT